MDILSTCAVAELLSVSEATVKRWADAGTLRCFRTPGGHRKFRLRDIRGFLADQRDEEISAVVPPIPTSSDLSDHEQFRNLALSGDIDGLVSLVAGQRLRGMSLAAAFDTVMAPALYAIGEGWSCGELSPAQEHLASNAVIDMLARIRPLVERSTRGELGRAVCACLGDEHHDIGVRMASLILVSEGYRASMVGANVPVESLVDIIEREKPAIVAVSASGRSNLADLSRDLNRSNDAAVAAGSHMIVGGSGMHALAEIPKGVQRYATLSEFVGFATRS